MSGDVGWHIVAISSIDFIRFQPARGNERDQLCGKKDIDVRGKDILSASSSDPGILCDHLEKGQLVAFKTAMDRLRNFDDSNVTSSIFYRPGERLA